MNTKEFEKQLFVENKEGNLSDLNLSFEDLWKNCLQLIKKKVPETVITFWLKPIVPLKYENNTLTIAIPSVIFYDYLEKQCMGLLRETLDNVRIPYIQGFNTKENVENNVRVLKEMGVVNIEHFDYTIISDNHLNVKNKNDLLGCLD